MDNFSPLKTLSHAFAAAKHDRSMILAAKEVEYTKSTDGTMLGLSLISFGLAAGIYALYDHYLGEQYQKEFVVIVKALVIGGVVTGERGQQQLSADYQGELVVKENGGALHLHHNGGVVVVLDKYTSINELLNAITDDIYQQSELYCSLDDGFIDSLRVLRFSKQAGGISTLPTNFLFSDVVMLGQQVDIADHNSPITYPDGKYYCKSTERRLDLFEASMNSGLTEDAPRYGLRSYFTYRLSQLLGFDVIAEVKFIENSNGWYYGLKEVKGISGYAYGEALDAKIFDDLLIIKQTIELQIVDALTGQVDRNRSNYLIDSGTKKVTGIDSDMCGGSKISHPNQATKAVHRAFWGVDLPPVLDTEIVKKIKSLSKNKLRSLMRECKFNDQEISAGVSRLNAVIDHVAELENKQADFVKQMQTGKQPDTGPFIIPPDQWTRLNVIRQLLTPLGDKNDHCYLGREERLFGQGMSEAFLTDS